MKIGTNYSLEKPQHCPNFGKLYMPKMAKVIEKERPWLEWLAQDMDIFLHPSTTKEGIRVRVQEITEPIVATGSRAEKRLANEQQQKKVNSKRNFNDIVPLSGENFKSDHLGYKIYAKALELKIEFNKLLHPHLPVDPETSSVVSSLRIITSKTPSPYLQAS